VSPEYQHLFSYGTLQLESIQLAIFGRKLKGSSDALTGYEVTMIPIRDEAVSAELGLEHYRNVRFTGHESDSVDGMVLEVTEDELKQADEYEDDAGYKRVIVRLRSGRDAWVYLALAD
jgi:hypothetical protein